MKMTPQQSTKAVAALNGIWRQPRRCEVCHQTDWSITPTIFELREFHGGDINLAASELLPLIAAACTTCGHTIMFSAIKLGIVTPGTPEQIPDGNYFRTGGREK